MGLTAADPLAGIRAQFRPGEGVTYLDTATYGLPPLATVDALERRCGHGRPGRATGSTTGTNRRTRPRATSRR